MLKYITTALILLTIAITDSLYAQECIIILPKKPQLSDSINPPIFLNNTGIEKIIELELRKIHKDIYRDNYVRALFCITIKKNGEAKELKLISVSRVYENDFKKIYPNILKKITHWKPATNIRTGKAVKYDLNIEIEFQKGDYKLVIYNNDIQKLLTTSLSLDQ